MSILQDSYDEMNFNVCISPDLCVAHSVFDVSVSIYRCVQM